MIITKDKIVALKVFIIIFPYTRSAYAKTAWGQWVLLEHQVWHKITTHFFVFLLLVSIPVLRCLRS